MNSFILHPITTWTLMILVLVVSPCCLLGITGWLIKKAHKAERGTKRDTLIWHIVSLWAFVILSISLSCYVFRPPQSIFVGAFLFLVFALVEIRLDQVARSEEKNKYEATQQCVGR